MGAISGTMQDLIRRRGGYLKQRPGEPWLDFLNRVCDEYAALTKEEAGWREEMRKEQVVRDAKPLVGQWDSKNREVEDQLRKADEASNGRLAGLEVERKALMGLLERWAPDRDLSAVAAKVKELDELMAMLRIQIAPKFGIPGPSWR